MLHYGFQLVELTNCSADAAIIALHDANNDLDYAIVALLEGESEVTMHFSCSVMDFLLICVLVLMNREIGKYRARKRNPNNQLNSRQRQLEKEKVETVVQDLVVEESGIGIGRDLVAAVEDHQDYVVEVVAATTKKISKKATLILSTDPVEEALVVHHVPPTALDEKYRAVGVVPVVVEVIFIYFFDNFYLKF